MLTMHRAETTNLKNSINLYHHQGLKFKLHSLGVLPIIRPVDFTLKAHHIAIDICVDKNIEG